MSLPDKLRELIETSFGIEIAAVRRLGGGDEATLWHAATPSGEFVVRVSPAWRTQEELAWTHRLSAFAATHCPEALTPLPTVYGEMMVRWRGRLVTVFPFIEGRHLDRNQAGEREAAARLLARLHRRLAEWEGGDRPPPGPDAPAYRAAVADPPELHGPDVDRWLTERGGRRHQHPIHGDYYGRNILWRDGAIVAVLDWDEAQLDDHAQEVGWAMWEFCQNDAGDDLILPRAQQFLGWYRSEGGRLGDDFGEHAAHFICQRLRAEVRRALAAKARSEPLSPDDEEYLRSEIRAFGQLRGLRL